MDLAKDPRARFFIKIHDTKIAPPHSKIDLTLLWLQGNSKVGKANPLRARYMRRMFAGLFLLAILAVPAAVHSHKAIEGLVNHPVDWVPDSLPEKAAFNELSRRFVVSDAVLIGWPGGELESESLANVTRSLNALCSHLGDSVDDRRSESAQPSDDADLPGAGVIQEIRDVSRVLHPFLNAKSGETIVQKMTASPSSLPRKVAVARLKGFLIGPDSKQSCVVITLDKPAHDNRREVVPLLRKLISKIAEIEPEKIAIVGGPRDGADVDFESIRSVRVFAPPSAVLAAIICFICLRSIPLTLAITTIAVIGEGMVLALVHYSGTPMNAVLIVLPPLVFVLTVSSGIHLSNYFIDATEEFPEMSPSQAAKRAVRAGLVPCLLATGTTVVGLGSLMLVRMEPIQVFGFVSSVGVTGTLMMLLLVLPGAMIIGREQQEKKRERKAAAAETSEPVQESEGEPKEHEPPSVARQRSKLYNRVRTQLSHPWPILIFFLLLAGTLSTGLFSLETSVNLLRMFQPGSPIRTEYAWFEENVGATNTAELLVHFPPLTEEDAPLDRLAVVRAAHLAAIQSEPVGGAISAMSFMRPVPKGRSLRASSTRAALTKMIRDEESGLGRLGMISRDSKSEIWRITLRLWEEDGVDYSITLKEIQDTVQQAVEPVDANASISLNGPAVVVHEAQRVLLRDLFRSFMTAFGIVAIVMIFVLRSFRGGLVAMIPNLFPTVTLFGYMGIKGTPLDIGSVMSASVALGIAVDDTVHLLSRFGSRRAQGLGQIRAAHGALSQCGWAMLQTTMVCGLSLMVYWFSDFVPTSQFALLMFGLLSAALFGDVFLLPSLMASPLGKYLARTVGSDPKAKLEYDADAPVDARRVRRK